MWQSVLCRNNFGKSWAQGGDPSGQFSIASLSGLQLVAGGNGVHCSGIWAKSAKQGWEGQSQLAHVGTVGVCLHLLSASFSPFAAQHKPDSPQHPQPFRSCDIVPFLLEEHIRKYSTAEC